MSLKRIERTGRGLEVVLGGWSRPGKNREKGNGVVGLRIRLHD